MKANGNVAPREEILTFSKLAMPRSLGTVSSDSSGAAIQDKI